MQLKFYDELAKNTMNDIRGLRIEPLKVFFKSSLILVKIKFFNELDLQVLKIHNTNRSKFDHIKWLSVLSFKSE